MLLRFGDCEVVEDYEKDEKVIDAEGNLQNITRYELERGLVSLPEVQDGREPGGQPNIHGAPSQRFAKPDDMAATVEEAQVRQQHPEHEKIEQNPEVEQWEFLAALGIVDCRLLIAD
jgi:hypothetical protein